MFQTILRSFLNLGLVPMLTFSATQAFYNKKETLRKYSDDDVKLSAFSNLPLPKLPRPFHFIGDPRVLQILTVASVTWVLTALLTSVFNYPEYTTFNTMTMTMGFCLKAVACIPLCPYLDD